MICWICLAVNMIGTVFGVIWIHYTGYLYKVTDSALGYDVKYYAPAAIITGLLVLVVGVIGYVVGQRQHGKPFSWKDSARKSPRPRCTRSWLHPGRPPLRRLRATDRRREACPCAARARLAVDRGGQIRTDDLVLPKHVRYQATLRPAAA